MKEICFSKKSLFPELFVSRNGGNSIKCKKNMIPPPPNKKTTHTFEIRNHNKGIEDILYIDSYCPIYYLEKPPPYLSSGIRQNVQIRCRYVADTSDIRYQYVTHALSIR